MKCVAEWRNVEGIFFKKVKPLERSKNNNKFIQIIFNIRLESSSQANNNNIPHLHSTPLPSSPFTSFVYIVINKTHN